MRKPRPEAKLEEDVWGVGWDANRRRQFTLGLKASPAERLRWLEEAIALAHRSGALPRRRAG